MSVWGMNKSERTTHDAIATTAEKCQKAIARIAKRLNKHAAIPNRPIHAGHLDTILFIARDPESTPRR